MCGIAGLIDLRGQREPDRATVYRMTDAILHRGPDEDGFHFAPGVGLGMRRLSIIGLADGQQPIWNEDRTIAVVFNGELFEYPEKRAELEAKGHVFRTHTDTELIPHLYEEYGEDLFPHLKGQFAFTIFDTRRRIVLMARDRVGICPLHWARQGDWLYFGSEIKALLASGAVPRALDERGLDHIFTFFAMSTRRTMFAGVNSVLPGHYLRIAFRSDGAPAEIVERRYWDLNFPDAGSEDDPQDEKSVVDEFEATFRRAVAVRLRADVPVVGYLSGGVDSSMVLATAARIRRTPLPSFTIGIPAEGLDETETSGQTARHVGGKQTVVRTGPEVISNAYPKLIVAADCPVIDTSCASLLCLSREVNRQGYKVALTGEGSDEALAGYPWFKLDLIRRFADFGTSLPGLAMSRTARSFFGPKTSLSELSRIDALTGGPLAQTIFYHAVSKGREDCYSDELFDRLDGHIAYEDLALDLERMRRWHPLNRSLYFGYKVFLAGLLLNHKGDRVAMANSVETRYPFLDEDVIALCSRLHPRWKLRGYTQDKYLLRRAAERVLPHEVANRPKGMFRAPFAESFLTNQPGYVKELISPESLAKTGLFDRAKIDRCLAEFATKSSGSYRHLFLGMHLTSVISTQLWHHLYLGGGLCSLPEWQAPTERPRVLETAGAPEPMRAAGE